MIVAIFAATGTQLQDIRVRGILTWRIAADILGRRPMTRFGLDSGALNRSYSLQCTRHRRRAARGTRCPLIVPRDSPPISSCLAAVILGRSRRRRTAMRPHSFGTRGVLPTHGFLIIGLPCARGRRLRCRLLFAPDRLREPPALSGLSSAKTLVSAEFLVPYPESTSTRPTLLRYG